MAGMHNDEQLLQKTREEMNLASVTLLLTDARLALTFLAVAETTQIEETAKRNIYNAHKAYDSIQQIRVKHVLTDTEAQALDTQLREVKKRLEDLGEEF